MSTLSNNVRESDGPGLWPVVEYRQARAEEVDDAVALLLGNREGPAGVEQVREFTQFASLRGIDLGNLWLAGSGDRLAWSLLPVVSPGRTMLLLSPAHLPAGVNVGPLVEAACAWFGKRGGLLAQALLDPAETAIREFFESHGFENVAQLHYLQTTIRQTAVPPPLPSEFSWQTYSVSAHDLFASAISQSYEGSLDCPALNGRREIEDVIAGHRASGQFDERFWFVLLEGGEPCAVLLLTRVPRNDLSELVYLGVSSRARGRGIGDLMMRQAFWAVRQMGLHRITLAVDSRNAPALKLYYRHGLHHAGTKTAMLRDLRDRGIDPIMKCK